MRTVPADFAVHSMHCYFVLAGDSALPILYHVERVRDGRSFITRTVQARQRGRPIFTTTLSFSRANSGGKKKLEHQTPRPRIPLPEEEEEEESEKKAKAKAKAGRVDQAAGGPFESKKAGVLNRESDGDLG
jgi:acyl-CoA thioesterase II